MPTVETQTGPPQASAAHARARTRRMLVELRHSWLFKLILGIGAVTLATALPMAWGGAPLAWYSGLRFVFTVLMFLLIVRVVFLLANETLWLLRNRLILAYVFMGVVPVLLIGGMLAIGAYMFYGQYAAYLLLNSMNERTQNVGAVNTLTVRELQLHPERASAGPLLSDYYASYYFPRGYGGVHSYFYTSSGQPNSEGARQLGPLSPWLRNGFVGVIAQAEGYALASFHTNSNAKGDQILTLYPLSSRNLDQLAQPLGQVSMGLSGFVDLSPDRTGITRGPAAVLASTAPLPPRSSIFDIQITTWAFIPVTDWNTGKSETVIATITTRPSLLNNQLFASFQSGPNPTAASRWPLVLLGVIAVGFLIIEFFSLLAGIRLTRTITGAVNDLYVGTEHINRGEFEHRIPVRTRDQLAALEISFNTMTASIQRLLIEQREKQKLENELNIAHEVQIQLFPRIPPRVAGLEIQGRCLPARVVSGDYYDFVQLGPERVSLALGDISGKGISAALLMATIVAAVRAYQPNQADLAASAVALTGGGGLLTMPSEEESRPAQLMARLNHQLYHSTPPEKYATLFYASYDGERRELRYTNAGHLPPAVVGARGVRRLERGGMVVGLFEDVSFEEGKVQLEPGDLLAAWSDGITEPENEYGVEFGEERLLQMLEAHRTRPLAEIFSTVLTAVHDWSGNGEQPDDITLVLARIAAAS